MKVIIFQGQSRYDVLRTFSNFYTQKMQEYGIETIICDMNIIDSTNYLEIVKEFKPDFTIGFNPVCYLYNEKKLHFEKTEIPHLVGLGDNPNYHIFNRALSKPNSPFVYTFTPEELFEYSFKQLGVERYSRTSFAPAEQHYKIGFKNKIYPTVFFGTYIEPDKIILQLKEVCKSNFILKVVLHFCTIIKEHVLYSKKIISEPLELAFANFLQQEYQIQSKNIISLTKEIYYFIDHFYRNLVRKVVLTTFAGEGLELIVFGKEDTSNLLQHYPNVKVLAPVSYLDYISLLAHSKIALNITPMFTSFHERVSTTLFNSTLLCTNIMEGLFNQYPKLLECTLTYNLNNLKETAQIIKEISNSEKDYNDAVELGLEVANQNFNYEKFINEIVDMYKSNF